MGILEFFSAIASNNITKKSIHNDIQSETNFDHFFIDFNSIVYVVYEKVLEDINQCMYICLAKLNKQQKILTNDISDTLDYYKIDDYSELNELENFEDINNFFKSIFNEQKMDQIMLTEVIKKFIKITKTFCSPQLKTLFIALDGIPSKGKLIEQRQRGIMGSLAGEYSKIIMEDYKDYIQKLGQHYWLWLNNKIKWSRTKIKPNTDFMNRLAKHLGSKQIKNILSQKFDNLAIKITDTLELGEAEMKIVRYINTYYNNSKDSFCIYSPDADVILLCMLLPVNTCYYLRYDQQRYNYSLINVELLKIAIGNYISANTITNLNFDSNRVINDIVFLSTLFGNDFVPKIETINVRRGFELILFSYIETINEMYNQYKKKFHLVKIINTKCEINFSFLKRLIFKLSQIEYDYIKYNKLYNRYLDAYMLRYTFKELDINENNVKQILDDFRQWYNTLQQKIHNKKNIDDLKKSKYLLALTRCIIMNNTNYGILPQERLLSDLVKFYQTNHKFPEIMFGNLKTINTSIHERRYKMEIQNKNSYEIQIMKFEKLLDEYISKFNGGPIAFDKNDTESYYEEYFDGYSVDDICADYIEGIVWVFNYYFVDRDYINQWYYKHEKAPLLIDIYHYLEKMSYKNFVYISKQLNNYKVDNIIDYFNPIEQLVYVSVYNSDTLKLIPKEYESFYETEIGKLFKYDLKSEAKLMKLQKKCEFLNCKGASYFTKCINKNLHKLTYTQDELFRKTIRKIKIDDKIIRKNTVKYPEY